MRDVNFPHALCAESAKHGDQYITPVIITENGRKKLLLHLQYIFAIPSTVKISLDYQNVRNKFGRIYMVRKNHVMFSIGKDKYDVNDLDMRKNGWYGSLHFHLKSHIDYGQDREKKNPKGDEIGDGICWLLTAYVFVQAQLIYQTRGYNPIENPNDLQRILMITYKRVLEELNRFKSKEFKKKNGLH